MKNCDKLVIKGNRCGDFAPLITHYNNNAVKNQHMEKQTAVEYLFEQLWETPKDKLTWHTILNKAKEIEQQQIIDTTTQENIRCTQIANDTLKVLGIEPLFMVDDTWGKHYYNNTFKNK